jgi:ribonuclease P protein component
MDDWATILKLSSMTKRLKKNILQKSEDISRVLKNKSARTQHLSFYQKSNLLENSRLGLAIPKKNAKRAIDRNRIKRLIREQFKGVQKLPAIDLVVKLDFPIGKQTRKKLREKERRAIRQELSDFFKKEI